MPGIPSISRFSWSWAKIFLTKEAEKYCLPSRRVDPGRIYRQGEGKDEKNVGAIYSQ